MKRPYIAYLDITTKEKPTTPSRSQKHRQSQRASTWEDNAVVKELALPTVIQLTDVVAHSLYTLVFMLEYVISWPLTQHDKVALCLLFVCVVFEICNSKSYMKPTLV